MVRLFIFYLSLFGFLILPASESIVVSQTGQFKNSRQTFAAWLWPVALPSDSSPEIKAAADRLSKALKNPLAVIQSERNPVCALWLEVGLWKPNPSTPGYVILIQPGGGQIIASDLKQLEKAISRLNQLKRIRNGKTELPIGVITSYPTIGKDNAGS
jgi:signal transduction histidine kinase